MAAIHPASTTEAQRNAQTNSENLGRREITLSEHIVDLETFKELADPQITSNPLDDDQVREFANNRLGQNQSILLRSLQRDGLTIDIVNKHVSYDEKDFIIEEFKHPTDFMKPYIPIFIHDVKNINGLLSLQWENAIDLDTFEIEGVDRQFMLELTKALENLLKVITPGLHTNNGELEGVTIEDLVDTLVFTSADIEEQKRLQILKSHMLEEMSVEGDLGIEFATVQEFISARTLVHNAMKEKSVGIIKVNIAQEETGERILQVTDDAKDPGTEEVTWDNVLANQIKDQYTSAQDKPEIDYQKSSGGLFMVAHTAGQRNSRFELHSGGGTKSVVVGFPPVRQKAIKQPE